MSENPQRTKRSRGKVIAAASDGACSGNPGPGGWGALIRYEDGSVEELGGHEAETTNNRMELTAALAIFKRLKNLPRAPNLKIRTDSKYLINGLSEWIKGWKRNNWKTASGKQVLNQDLWNELDEANLNDVKLEYVKGHSGDQDNERVDRIAVNYSKGNHFKNCNPQNLITENPENKSEIEHIIREEQESNMKELVTRLDVVNNFARKGYSLNIKELSQLLKKPIKEIESHQDAWEWRDWLIEPVGNSRWKLSFNLPRNKS